MTGCPTPRKRRHPTRSAAEGHALDLRRKHGCRDVNVYRCPCGQHWHVTSHDYRSLQTRIRRSLRRNRAQRV